MTTLIPLLLLAHAPAKLKPYTIAPGFIVSLPAAPKVLAGLPKSPDVDAQCWYVKLANGAIVISVAKSLRKEEASWSAEKVLANFRAGFMHSAVGNETSHSDITLGGWSGVDSRFETASGINGWQRCYYAGGKIYQVASMATAPTKELPDTKAIMDSIKLPKK